jgi:phospholipid transport system substrate-binding protein
MKRLYMMTLILTFVLPWTGNCAQPMDVLKAPMDEVVRILKDPDFQNGNKREEQRQKLWDTLQVLFDFREISIRTLARNWKKFSKDQQAEFVEVFSEFLGNIYIERLRGEYKNEKIVFEGEEMVSDTKAIVKTKIVRENNIEVPVEYRMRYRKENWRIYDVRIEGVSLVKNYRTQFKQILMKETPDQLIQKLKDKLEKQNNRASSVRKMKKGVFVRSKHAWQLLAQKYFLVLWLDNAQIKAH